MYVPVKYKLNCNVHNVDADPPERRRTHGGLPKDAHRATQVGLERVEKVGLAPSVTQFVPKQKRRAA